MANGYFHYLQNKKNNGDKNNGDRKIMGTGYFLWQTQKEIDKIRNSINRQAPLGNENWVIKMAKKHGLRNNGDRLLFMI